MPDVSAVSVSPTCAVPLMVGTPVAGVLLQFVERSISDVGTMRT